MLRLASSLLPSVLSAPLRNVRLRHPCVPKAHAKQAVPATTRTSGEADRRRSGCRLRLRRHRRNGPHSVRSSPNSPSVVPLKCAVANPRATRRARMCTGSLTRLLRSPHDPPVAIALMHGQCATNTSGMHRPGGDAHFQRSLYPVDLCNGSTP